MAVVIRHGSNGAFKSATAVDKYLIPAIKQGRPVVTNLRGVSLERCYRLYSDLPETLTVEYVDTSTAEGKAHFARWFHWVPLGALIIIDEASSVFPKSWRDADIKKLDYPGGPDQANADDRPENWLTAFEMQRHYNWDVVLTTPNIKNIRDDIRNTTEMAYRQRNLGKAFEKLRIYKEVQHDPMKTGFSLSDAISVSTQRVNKDAFELYDSTKTGLHQGSNAGKSILANPKILLLLSALVAVLGYLSFSGGPELITGESVATASGVEAPAPVPAIRGAVAPAAGSGEAAGARSGDVRAIQRREDVALADPLAGKDVRILGTFNGETQIQIISDGKPLRVTPSELAELGYSYYPVSTCLGKLVFGRTARLLMCSPVPSRDAPSDPRADQPQGA